MGRIAGTPNKITKEVKEKLQVVIDKTIDNIDISELDSNQKIKLLQIGLQYVVPRLKYTFNDEGCAEQPLFTDVEILTRNDEGEIESEIYNNSTLKPFE